MLHGRRRCQQMVHKVDVIIKHVVNGYLWPRKVHYKETRQRFSKKVAKAFKVMHMMMGSAGREGDGWCCRMSMLGWCACQTNTETILEKIKNLHELVKWNLRIRANNNL